ncbi:hypothetical protein ACFL6S_11230 [Candidatus Poribacteria bacterium]
MSDLFQQKQNRREFFRGIGRYMLLGGLVSTSGVLVTRRKMASAEEKSVDISICRSCTFLGRCKQPDALLTREEMARL